MNASCVQLHRIYASPAAIAILELQLHEVASDGCEHHIAWLRANLVLELRHGIEARAA